LKTRERVATLFYVIFFIFALVLGGCNGGGGGGSSSGTTGTGGTISLAWDANAESDLAGYRLYYGTASGVYDHPVDVGKVTTYTLTGLTKGQTYYIVVRAYDTSSNESADSNPVSGAAK
jgi:hypothetical protein